MSFITLSLHEILGLPLFLFSAGTQCSACLARLTFSIRCTWRNHLSLVFRSVHSSNDWPVFLLTQSFFTLSFRHNAVKSSSNASRCQLRHFPFVSQHTNQSQWRQNTGLIVDCARHRLVVDSWCVRTRWLQSNLNGSLLLVRARGNFWRWGQEKVQVGLQQPTVRNKVVSFPKKITFWNVSGKIPEIPGQTGKWEPADLSVNTQSLPAAYCKQPGLCPLRT